MAPSVAPRLGVNMVPTTDIGVLSAIYSQHSQSNEKGEQRIIDRPVLPHRWGFAKDRLMRFGQMDMLHAES